MNRISLAVFLALVFFAGSSRADTITLPCYTTISTNPGSDASSCYNSSGAAPGPFLIVSSPDSVGDASAGYQATVQVEFTGGPTSLLGGYFVPCLTAYTESPLAYASAQLGTALVETFGSLGTQTCPASQTTPSIDEIPFTFGVQSTYQLYLYGDAYEGTHSGGFSLAFFEGFDVFDLAGNLIPATVTYSYSTPEPAPALLLFPAAVCCAMIFLRRKRNQ